MIDCKKIYNKKITELKKLHDKYNKEDQNKYLAILSFNNSNSFNIYAQNIVKDCNKVGIRSEIISVENKNDLEIYKMIENLNNDEKVAGIIIQQPFPSSLDYISQLIIKNSIKWEKDIDNISNKNCYIQATVLGVLEVLEEEHIDLEGKVSCIIGRSENLGLPLVNNFIRKHATVINCNSLTKNLEKHIKESEIIVSATGKANLIKKDWVNAKQVIIDVGISVDENKKICGDCEKEIYNIVDKITPVPNGVGYLTRIGLLNNFMTASLA